MLHHEQRLPRIGKDVDRRQLITASAFDRIAWILTEYKNLAVQHRADTIVATATSAVRDAANKHEFSEYIKQVTGITIEILSGKEEAALTYLGTVSGFPGTGAGFAVLDIGGGSTELTFPNPGARNGNPRLHQYSIDVGAVRLTERFFRDDPPTPAEVGSARTYIREELSQVRNPGLSGYRLVGVAGTVTTLACLDQGLPEFEVSRVAGYRMNSERVGSWCQKLCSMRSSEIRALSNAAEGRADILGAGTLILSEFMSLFGCTDLTVSERGLRYGRALKAWEDAGKPG